MVERIEALCKKNHVSFRKVEIALGFSNGIIRSWEKKTPSADKLAAVASYFGVSMEYLLTGEEIKKPADTDGLSEDELILLSAFRSLTEDQRQFVLRQLRAAAQDQEDPASGE